MNLLRHDLLITNYLMTIRIMINKSGINVINIIYCFIMNIRFSLFDYLIFYYIPITTKLNCNL